MPFHYRNVNGDELIFVEGDYVVVPKGVTYRLIPETRDNMFYITQTTGPIGFPERGLLGQYVPFDFGMLRTPEPRPAPDDDNDEDREWQGTVAPFKLSMYDIRSISPERLDIPPGGYATFRAPGTLICTFTPRPMRSDPDSSFVPPYHRNIDVERPLTLTPEYRSYTQDQQELARTTASQR